MCKHRLFLTKTFFLAGLIPVLFSACASAPQVRDEFPVEYKTLESEKIVEEANEDVEDKSQTEADPIVQPGFLFEIKNMEDRKLNGRFRVDFDGSLKLPYDVNIQTEDRRASEVKSKIHTKNFFKHSRPFQFSSLNEISMLKFVD